MRIVIFGTAKSGTTALFAAIRRGLKERHELLFEPAAYRGGGRNALAKVLINERTVGQLQSFSGFERRILIVRDPRDCIVSSLLYNIYNNDPGGPERTAAFIGAMRAKQQNPRSVSLVSLVDLLARLSAWRPLDSHVNRRLATEFHDRNPDLTVVRYEDAVAGNLGPLENYLGQRVSLADLPGDPALDRVHRRGGVGDWRHWFVEEDVAAYRPLCSSYMARYGYGDDWTPAEEPQILPEHSYEYVARLVKLRAKGR